MSILRPPEVYSGFVDSGLRAYYEMLAMRRRVAQQNKAYVESLFADPTEPELQFAGAIE